MDHLRATVSEVPVPDADYGKQYLVISDSVPGGTGYLKQLMHEKNALIEIFEKALQVMENCSCKEDPQKDGCYHYIISGIRASQVLSLLLILGGMLLYVVFVRRNKMKHTYLGKYANKDKIS